MQQPDNAKLDAIANTVFATVVRKHSLQWAHMSRYEVQEAVRGAAIESGVENKTSAMRHVVTKCLARAGFGS